MYFTTPPRQAAPATPPQEGNVLHNTTPSGFACHPSTGEECTSQHHPVRLRLPPLHRRGMYFTTPPHQAAPATPPQEGNVLHNTTRQAAPATPPQEGNVLHNTTPSGCACHPSTGGECTSQHHPVRLRLPPLHRRGMYFTIPLLWRGGRRSLTGWCCEVHSPPVEGWQAQPDGVVL